MASELVEPVERGDLDELLRLVDALCSARDWELLLELRDRCARAIERGRQLWPVATNAEYRLALEAPAPFAGEVLVEGAGRFAPGPLPEVAASTHSWAELRPHVAPGPAAVVTAHERVVRGEDATSLPPAGPPVLELPLRLAAWEPAYLLAEYRADGAHFPGPDLPPLTAVELPRPAPGAQHDEATDALLDLVRAWVEGSDGRAEGAAVSGDARDAIAALGRERARWGTLDAGAAVRMLAWAGSNGGAYGRRPGAAAGRFGAWWSAAAMTGLLDCWPVDATELGAAIAGLRWYVWDAGGPAAGWSLHLAVEDPRRRRAWAVAAVDAR